MRIWDVSPGYLNRQSLLGEHRELHGIVSIIVNNRKGYSNHPETKRWVGYGWALRMRHQLLAAEMSLRSYTDRTPVITDSRKGLWPEVYIDEPGEQFRILQKKYLNRDSGRISLPIYPQQLWSQHKYSVMARDVSLYKDLGRRVSRMRTNLGFDDLSRELTEVLRICPSSGGTRNALQHMWGYVSDGSSIPAQDVEKWSLSQLLLETQRRVLERQEPYLISSTALSELTVWIENL